MGKRALIAEPDPEEALRQAAVLADEGFEAEVFKGSDLLVAIEQNPPDVVFLRHERPGQGGLALVGRVKKQGIAAGTAIVLTTSDLTPDAIEKHASQKYRADVYLRLPADRTDLVNAARSVPQVHEAKDVAEQEQDAAKPQDPKRPPPLPNRLAAPRSTSPGAKGGEAMLSADDLNFVEKVFSSIQHIDADAPVVAEAVQVGDGPDRKLALLRTKLKERERDLAKLSRLWRAREQELRESESRYQQKDIEVESLRMRTKELDSEILKLQALLVEKESEFGKQIGDTYDQHSLNEAELIQAVAGKEHELDKLKRKLKKAEDEAIKERSDLTERIFEWEKAYAQLETHHWQVVQASFDEMMRLEAQLTEREASKGSLRAELVQAESAIVVERARVQDLKRDVLRAKAEGAEREQHLLAVAGAAVDHEKHRRIEAEEGHAKLRDRVFHLEVDLDRHRRLLGWLDGRRRSEIARVVTVLRATEDEVQRLIGDRERFRARSIELEHSLDQARALGEATVNALFTISDRERTIAAAQISVRDAKLTEMTDDAERAALNLNEVTERLGQSEMEHASMTARADDLDRALGEVREQLAATESQLTSELEATTAQRDKLHADLEKTTNTLGDLKDELYAERRLRQNGEVELSALKEKREQELKDRAEKIADLERTLTDAREDIQNFRKTIGVRDERITELLTRLRSADEAQVALDGQVFRLTQANSEKEADLVARDERIAKLMEKGTQRDERIEALEGEGRQQKATLAEKLAHIERLEVFGRELTNELARVREGETNLRTELDRRAQDLFEAERKLTTSQAELANARSEITSGQGIIDELTSRLKATEDRRDEFRRGLEDVEARLRSSLQDLEGAGQRVDQLTANVERLRTRVAELEPELARRTALLSDTERQRDGLSSTKEMLEQSLKEAEEEKTSLEEQLDAQVRENAELSATLGESHTSVDTLRAQLKKLESAVTDRDGRIAAQTDVLGRVEARANEQQVQLAAKDEELAEVRSALDEQRRAVEERARWLATREASIAELKTALDVEKQARAAGEAEAAKANELRATTESSLEEANKKLAAERTALGGRAQGAEAELGKTKAEKQAALDELKAKKMELGNLTIDVEKLRADLTRATEGASQGEKAKLEAQKMREHAEKAVAEMKAARAQAEQAAQGKQKAEAEAAAAKGELEKLRTQSTQGDQALRDAKADAEAQKRKVQEAQGLLQRLNQAHNQSKEQMKTLEQKLQDAAEGRAADLRQQQQQVETELTKMREELATARKAQRDAAAAAQQARAERDEFKRKAMERLQQAEQKVREMTGTHNLPPRPSTPPGAAAPGSQPPAAAAAPRPAAPAAARPAPSAPRPAAPAAPLAQPPPDMPGSGEAIPTMIMEAPTHLRMPSNPGAVMPPPDGTSKT